MKWVLLLFPAEFVPLLGDPGIWSARIGHGIAAAPRAGQGLQEGVGQADSHAHLSAVRLPQTARLGLHGHVPACGLHVVAPWVLRLRRY